MPSPFFKTFFSKEDVSLTSIFEKRRLFVGGLSARFGKMSFQFSTTPFKNFYDLATSAVENDKTNHLDSVTDDGFTEKKLE